MRIYKGLANLCFEFFSCLGKVFDDQKKCEQYSYNYGDGPEECATTGFGSHSSFAVLVFFL